MRSRPSSVLRPERVGTVGALGFSEFTACEALGQDVLGRVTWALGPQATQPQPSFHDIIVSSPAQSAS